MSYEKTTCMKKTLLSLLCSFFILGHFGLNAQTTYEIECTMTVDEISAAQPFDVDDPAQESVWSISGILFTELNLMYDKLNNGLENELEEHIQAINAAIDSAVALGMNYSMFDADLDFIETLP
jgi:hypothetical protein